MKSGGECAVAAATFQRYVRQGNGIENVHFHEVDSIVKQLALACNAVIRSRGRPITGL